MGNRNRPEKDLPPMMAELIEMVAALRFKDIRKMSIPEFIRKYRDLPA